jgi:hypothetical protein
MILLDKIEGHISQGLAKCITDPFILAIEIGMRASAGIGSGGIDAKGIGEFEHIPGIGLMIGEQVIEQFPDTSANRPVCEFFMAEVIPGHALEAGTLLIVELPGIKSMPESICIAFGSAGHLTTDHRLH